VNSEKELLFYSNRRQTVEKKNTIATVENALQRSRLQLGRD
jgi:hypothetical protein